jgi:uncharacterized protein (TIGR02466 family)
MQTTLALFPTPVFVAEIGSLIPTEFAVINSVEMLPNSSGNSYSKDTKILNSLPELYNRILPYLQNYIDTVLCPSTNVGLRITQSWINKNDINQSHHIHNHDNSIISGVYYISPNIPSSILFHRNKDSNISYNIGSYNPFNSLDYKVNVQQGMLILFPSSLNHSVENNTGSEQRISLAFNTFFTGTIGDEMGLTKLELT